MGRYAIIKTTSIQEKYKNSDIFLNLLEYLIANIAQQSNDKGLSIYRVLTIELEEIEFRNGFTDFHKVSYNEPLVGKGYGLVYAMSSTEKVNEIKKV